VLGLVGPVGGEEDGCRHRDAPAPPGPAGECERLVVVSGDTDIVPAIDEARAVWAAQVGVAFPARRANAQLRRVASWSVNLDPAWYLRHQLPCSVTAADGHAIVRPSGWQGAAASS